MALRAGHMVCSCLTIIAKIVKITRKIIRYFKLNDNKGLAYQNLWDAMRTVL